MRRRTALLLLLMASGARPESRDGATIAINVVLEPDTVMQSYARALNTRLRRADSSGFALDAGHAAHLTVLQCVVRRDDLETVTAVVAGLARQAGMARTELQAKALNAASFGGRGMLAIRVAQTPALTRFHAALLTGLAPFMRAEADSSAFDPEPGGGPVSSATAEYVRDFRAAAAGDRYQPHLTAGVGPPAVVAQLAAQRMEPFGFRVEGVAIYQLGDFGTARRRLWSQAPGP